MTRSKIEKCKDNKNLSSKQSKSLQFSVDQTTLITKSLSFKRGRSSLPNTRSSTSNKFGNSGKLLGSKNSGGVDGNSNNSNTNFHNKQKLTASTPTMTTSIADNNVQTVFEKSKSKTKSKSKSKRKSISTKTETITNATPTINVKTTTSKTNNNPKKIKSTTINGVKSYLSPRITDIISSNSRCARSSPRRQQNSESIEIKKSGDAAATVEVKKERASEIAVINPTQQCQAATTDAKENIKMSLDYVSDLDFETIDENQPASLQNGNFTEKLKHLIEMIKSEMSQCQMSKQMNNNSGKKKDNTWRASDQRTPTLANDFAMNDVFAHHSSSRQRILRRPKFKSKQQQQNPAINKTTKTPNFF